MSVCESEYHPRGDDGHCDCPRDMPPFDTSPISLPKAVWMSLLWKLRYGWRA